MRSCSCIRFIGGLHFSISELSCWKSATETITVSGPRGHELGRIQEALEVRARLLRLRNPLQVILMLKKKKKKKKKIESNIWTRLRLRSQAREWLTLTPTA